MVSNLGVSIVNVTRMADPYSTNCTDHFPLEYQSLVPDKTEYSSLACNSFCFHKMSLELCECIDPLSDFTAFKLKVYLKVPSHVKVLKLSLPRLNHGGTALSNQRVMIDNVSILYWKF